MHAFNDTILPAQSINPSHITLLDDFFRAVDSLTHTDGTALANLFTPDGIWKTPSAKFSGSELKQAHKWPYLQDLTSMRHWVTRVYVNTDNELMLSGRIVCKGKTDLDVDFGARVVIEGGKLKFFQGWSSRV